jgi:hypothetical protein
VNEVAGHLGVACAAIAETLRIMKAIDDVVDEHGGWPGAFITKPTGGKE